MEPREVARIMSTLAGAWPQRMTEEAENFWLRELVSYEYADASAAMDSLKRHSEFRPSWASFVDAVREVRRARAMQDVPALPSASELTASDGDQDRAAQRRFVAEMRGMVKRSKQAQHWHGSRRWPVVDPDTGDQATDVTGEFLYRVTVGAASCDLCSRHDHSDATVIGYTVKRWRGDVPGEDGQFVIGEHKMPVPVWFFLCPECGDVEAASEQCTTWTHEGAQFRRRYPELFAAGEPITLEHANDQEF